MYIAMFVVPIIYLANAFFIGRLIKRTKAGSNDFLNTILGFLSLITLMYFINILLYSMRAQVWGYALTYGIFQIILLGAYIFNWKYLIFKPRFSLKKLIVFVVITGIVIGIGFACFRDAKSMFGEYWMKTIPETLDPKLNNVIIFDNNPIVNFSVMNISNIFWSNIFKLKTQNEILKFVNVSWTILASLFCGAIGAWIVDETRSIPRMVLLSLCICFTVVVSLAFIESFAIPDAWLVIELLVYILALVSHKNNSPYKLISLTIILLAMVGTTSNGYFLVFGLFIFSIYWAVRNNANSISYLLFLGWSAIHVIAGFISTQGRYVLLVVNIIYTIFMVVLIIVHAKIGTPAWEVKVAQGISKQSSKIVYAFLGIFIAIILISNLFIFYEKYNFDFKKIDYRNFLTFIYKYIWTFEITSGTSIAVINTILYVLFVSIVIAFLVLRKSKNSKGYWITKDVPIKLGVVAAILFCNPLSVHIFNVATQDFSLNTSNMNTMLLVPFVIYGMESTLNYKIYTIEKWNYYWI